jgi:hypothetical protein
VSEKRTRGFLGLLLLAAIGAAMPCCDGEATISDYTVTYK